MKCPRCGKDMSGGICNNCGFPANRIQNEINFPDYRQARLRHIL